MHLDDDTFWAKYRACVTMRNPAWRAKRRAVMQRCRYLCEACHQQRARHVHHLTYDRLGNELLEDLQAMCHDCHAAAHPHRKELGHRRRRQMKSRMRSRVVVAQPTEPVVLVSAPPPSPEEQAKRDAWVQQELQHRLADQRFTEAARALRRRQRRSE